MASAYKTGSIFSYLPGQIKISLVLCSLLLLAPSICFAAEFPELKWLHPSTDRLQHLSISPAECLDLSGSPEQRYQIEVGRQAFRSPALLGGQAARVELSCQGCHINGHSHPSFFIEGASGASGTVDVTTALFSELRGDGLHNPVLIPSLVDISQKQHFGTMAIQDSLTAFVEALIVEEFAGEKPPPVLLSSLVDYLQALTSTACPLSTLDTTRYQTTSINLDQQLVNILRSVDVVNQAYGRNEIGLVDFLIISAQHELSLVYQRFAIEGTAEAAQEIIVMSRRLEKLRNIVDSPDKSKFVDELQRWTFDWTAFSLKLKELQNISLYQKEILERWLIAHP